MENEDYQDWITRVVKEAKRRLKKNRPICVDGLSQYYPDRFNRAVEYVMDQTIYYDGE